MKLLITGASGYLGRRLARRAAREHTVFSGFAHRRDQVPAGEPLRLDLLQPEATAQLIRRLRPDAVIHTAVVNPAGPAETMMKVNADGSRCVAEVAAEIGARLVHVSTDVVHDGRQAPYADDAASSPLGLYGRSKAVGEREVLTALPTATIVRTSLIYALDEIDHGTAGFLACLRRGETVRLFNDVWRQPVWAETLAEALLRLVDSDFSGYLNVAGSQALTREQFGRRLLAFWGHGDDSRIESVSAGELELEVPLDLRLRLDRARELLAMPLPGVDEVLARGREALYAVPQNCELR